MYLKKGSFFPRRPNGMERSFAEILVRGTHHRPEELEGFLREFKKLKPNRDSANVTLFHDSKNKYDASAVGVNFTTTRKTWTGWNRKSFHVGFVEAGKAEEVLNTLNSKSVFTKLESFKTDYEEKYPYTIIVSIFSKSER